MKQQSLAVSHGKRTLGREIVFIIVLCLATFVPADAQTWRSLTTTNGLSHNGVAVLLEDRDGNFWVGTVDGLSQFNGLFTTHLPGREITSLLEFRDAIWAGTNGEGLHRYDGATWTEQLDGMNISSLMESTDGRLWAGTWLDGLHSYDGVSWKKQLNQRQIESLLETKDGVVWAGTADGLYSYDGMTWTAHLRGIKVRSLLESADGVIWAGTQQNGLYHYDGTQWTNPLMEMNIQVLLESANREIWVGTVGHGVHRYNGRTWSAALAGMNILSLLEDRDEGIWAGTAGQGLHYYNGVSWITQLTGMSIQSLLESRDGKIWAGTWRNGVQSYDGKTWRTSLTGMSIQSLLGTSDSAIWAGTSEGLYRYDGTAWETVLSEVWVLSLLEDKDGVIWAGTLRSGLYHYDGITWSQELDGMRIYSLLASADGVIWAGTNGEGVHRYDGQAWTTDLAGLVIRALLEATDGTIWAGTWGGGVFGYDGTKWTNHLDEKLISVLLQDGNGGIWAGTTAEGLYRFDGTWTELLSSIGITALLELQDGRIGVGVSGEGLRIFDGTTWSAFTVLGELSSVTVHAILEERDGNLWFGTENGIAVYRPNHDNPPLVNVTTPNEHAIIIGTTSLFIEWVAGDIETETDNLIYQHKIDNRSWTDPVGFAFTTLTNLEDGEHLFSVRALDLDLNPSQPDTLTITVDTIQPNVLIGSPAQGEVVGDVVQIIGGITDSDLEEFWVEYAVGANPADENFILIQKSNQEVVADLLAQWNTQSLAEDLYTIRLGARDRLNHEKDYRITVTLDNTSPKVDITSPITDQTLSGDIPITAEISDEHIRSYRLEYTKKTERWIQIETSEISESPAVVQTNWNTAAIGGEITLRFVAIDAAGNESHDSVELRLNNRSPNLIARIDKPSNGEIIHEIVESRVVPMAGMDLIGYTLSLVNPSTVLRHQTEDLDDDNSLKINWDTIQFRDGEYILQLEAVDNAELISTHEVRVTVDNTPPIAVITSPRQNEQVGDVVRLIGTADDETSFESYVVEFRQAGSQDAWTRATTTTFLEPKRSKELMTWVSGDRAGDFALRLTVSDQVGQTSDAEVTINIQPPIKGETGGRLQSTDNKVHLYFPPNSFTNPRPTISTLSH